MLDGQRNLLKDGCANLVKSFEITFLLFGTMISCGLQISTLSLEGLKT